MESPKLAYCRVLKAGSTFWIHNFAKLHGIQGSMEKNLHTQIMERFAMPKDIRYTDLECVFFKC